jgi:hypothetical protein
LETKQVNIRLSAQLIRDLKKVAAITHECRYQRLISDVLRAYVKNTKHIQLVSRKTREIEKELRGMIVDDDFLD